jgi:hypothetical protein
MRHFRNPNHVEPSEETGSDMVAATIRRTTCSYENDILNVHEVKFLQVIETTMVDDLPEEFNGGLGEVLFRSGHVDVITEEHHFLPGLGGAQQSGLPFLKLVFVHENVEDVAGLGLC